MPWYDRSSGGRGGCRRFTDIDCSRLVNRSLNFYDVRIGPFDKNWFLNLNNSDLFFDDRD